MKRFHWLVVVIVLLLAPGVVSAASDDLSGSVIGEDVVRQLPAVCKLFSEHLPALCGDGNSDGDDNVIRPLGAEYPDPRWRGR